MYVSKLVVKNYRNFSSFEINLKPFTIIIGENNTGKTNLLNALGIIFSNEIIFFKKRTLEIDDINYRAVYDFKEKVADNNISVKDIEFPEVKIEVIMEDFDKDQEAVVGDWFIDKELKKAKLTYVFTNRNPKKLDWIEEQRKYLTSLKKEDKETDTEYLERKINKIDLPIKDYNYIIHGGDDETKPVDTYFLKMLRMECLDALRDAKRELIASGDNRLLYKILGNRDETKFSDLKEELNLLHQKIQGNEELKKIKLEIITYLDKMSLQGDGTNNNVDFQFSSIETSELLKKLSLIYGIEPINVERNGLGRNNLLYISLILSHLSTKSSILDNIFFRLIAIEEPESHLHPHLQEHLAKNITKENDRNNQIIITSHSTHITSKLDLENTVILYKNENSIKNHYILSNFGVTAEDKKTVRYLRKYLDATNSALFFSRKIILVEGISEQLLIPIFFEKIYEKPIEKVGCNIVNVNGLAFKNFLDIIKNGYFVKCIVLTDSDEGTILENRADALIEKYSSCSAIKIGKSGETTFEKDIIRFNSNGPGRNVLLKALEATRPVKGKEYKEKLGDGDIDLQGFFKIIEEYKSEFAYNLSENLNEVAKGSFTAPDYIKTAFEFLMEN